MALRAAKYHWDFILTLLLIFGVVFSGMIDTGPSERILESARRTAAASNLAQIAKTYAAYSNGSTNPRNIHLPSGSTVHDAAFILAKYAGLNNASFYFAPNDSRSPDPLPQVVIQGDLSTATSVAPDFANATLSVVLVANLSTTAPPSTTPIAWTRGLQPDGTWAHDSPYRNTGGHIAFLDGHVAWFDQLDAKDPQMTFYKYGTNIPTHNIADALPPGAIILPAEPHLRPNP